MSTAFDHLFEEAYLKDFRFNYIDHLASQDSQFLGLKSCSLMWFDFHIALFESRAFMAHRRLLMSRQRCGELRAFVLHMRRIRTKFLETVRASLTLQQLILFQLDHHEADQLFSIMEYSRRALEISVTVNDFLVDFWTDQGVDISTPFYGPGY